MRDADTRLPKLTEVEQAADQILLLLEKHDGVTFSLYFGDMSRQELYAVSLYPERGKRASGRKISLNILRQFIRDNLDLLIKPENNIGLWYSSGRDKLHRDISAALPSRQEAINLAQQYNQIAIFDLANAEEILTGGSGKLMPDWPPEGERLPSLKRREEL